MSQQLAAFWVGCVFAAAFVAVISFFLLAADDTRHDLGWHHKACVVVTLSDLETHTYCMTGEQIAAFGQHARGYSVR
jgi:hypothetical protein